jgi:hypothetical protein
LVGEICATHPITTSLNRFSISEWERIDTADDVLLKPLRNALIPTANNMLYEIIRYRDGTLGIIVLPS